ncbi:MAG: thioredoxin family protein [Pontiella sp.]
MRTIKILFILFLLGASSVWAGSENWLTDFEKAKAEAASRKVPILVDFAGSDWCGWCIRLDNEVFSKPEFQTYAKDNLVLFLADFPSGKEQTDAVKKQNKALAEKYGIEGFPAVRLLDSTGKVLGKTGYKKGGAASYVEHIKTLLN